MNMQLDRHSAEARCCASASMTESRSIATTCRTLLASGMVKRPSPETEVADLCLRRDAQSFQHLIRPRPQYVPPVGIRHRGGGEEAFRRTHGLRARNG